MTFLELPKLFSPKATRLICPAVVLFAAIVLTLANPVRAARKPKKTMPTIAKVEEHTIRFLSGLEDYEPGDILARSQVEPLFDILYQLGWRVSDQKRILKSLPADRDFLFQQFQTPIGKKFMRQISGNPANFARLDHLLWTKGGHLKVVEIMKLPNGPQVAEALVTSSEGKEIGRRLSKSKGRDRRRKPPMKTYSVTQLVDRLKQSHAKDAAREKKAATKSTQGSSAAN